MISAIPTPRFPFTHRHSIFYKTLIHKQVKHHINFHYQSNHSYSTADAPTINSKPYSYIYPVVMYNGTGATLKTLKIIRYRNCNNNKIQQILNSYWEMYIIHTVYCCLFWHSGGSIKTLSCIPLTAYLTHPKLGQIIHLCIYFKETLHRIDSIELYPLITK